MTEVPNVQAFGDLVRRHRLLRRLTQEQLADASGVSVRTVSNVEGGRVRHPHRDTVGLLADALQLGGADRAVFLISADVPYWERRKPAMDEFRSPLLVPAQLPSAARPFVGRRGELAELDAATRDADATAHLVLVTGAAGTGKTALAVRWAHGVRGRYPDGQIFVNLRGYDPTSPAQPTDVLASVLRAFGVPNALVPQDPDDRSALLRSVLAGRRVLLILDNAGGAEQVRPLLPGGGLAAVVVTSRDRSPGLVVREGARRLDLGPLPRPEAVELLAALIDGDVDGRTLGVLADRCDRLPLALRVAAEAVASTSGDGLSGVLTQLTDDGRRLDLLDVSGDRHSSVRVVFSWSYGRLAPQVARAFRLLALHPGKDHDLDTAAAILGLDRPTARQQVRQLAQAHLIEQQQPGRWQMHDLLKAYGSELAGRGDRAEKATAVGRLLEHGLRMARTGDIGWLDQERANLVAACLHAAHHGWDRQAVELADALWRYLDNRAHYAEGRTVHTTAIAAARRLGDRASEATGEHHLAVVHWRWGEHDAAWQHFTEALAAYRDARDTAGEAAVLGNLGVLCWRWGRHPAARSYLEQAERAFRQAGNTPGEAGALNNQALVAYRQGDYRSSIGLLRRSLALRRGTGDPNGEARTLDNLGEVYQRVGDFAEAQALHEQALALFRQAGDRYGEGRALANRGAVHQHLGRFEQASADLHDADTLLADIGDATGRGEVALRLCALFTASGSPERAIREGERALSLFEQVGDLNWLSTALNNLGEAHRATGHTESARQRHWAARRVAIRAGDLYERARAHQGMADALRREDPGRATVHRNAATAIYLRLGIRSGVLAGEQVGQRRPI